MDDQNHNNEMVPGTSRNKACGLLALALLSGIFSAEVVARPQVYAVNDTIEAVFGSPPEYVGTTVAGDSRFAAYQGDDPNSLISYLLLYQEEATYVGTADLESHIRSFVEEQAGTTGGSTIHFSFGRIGDEVGAYFTDRLLELQTRHEVIGQVRGKGLMIGVELVEDRESRKPAKALCQNVLHRAFHNGLILLSCGASTVRFMPPLMITRRHVDEALSILEASLVEAQALHETEPVAG